MGLIVPILRVTMLLLNIYETFKVLKLPRPSPRNSGQPTIRALSQRKRNMKGCLAVWIVWCCFMVYERMAEGIVSLFIPFYDEFKSLVLLFLILTRARGAEPIFLHVIRPLLRPYTSTLDAFSDVGRMFGDIVFLLMAYPFRLVSSWWHDMFASEDRAGGGLYSEVQQALHSVSHQMPQMPIPSGGRRRSSGPLRPDVQPRAAEPNAPPPPYVVTAPSVAMPVPVHAVHEVWHPPRSAYHDDEDYLDPAPMPSPWEADDARRAREQQEEWRQYPAFPSAYPPTPLPAPSSQLPSFAPRQFSPIPEDAPPGQDFGQSLPSPHELPNPGSAKDSSDDDNTLGIQSSSSNAFQDDTMDEDEEEDDFDVTLRTPGSLVVPDTVVARMTRSRTKSSQPPSGPTLVALPSLLSRIASDASSVSSDSSTSSLLGRKRSREIVAPTQPAGGRNASKHRAAPATNDLQAMSEDESSDASSPSPSGGEENTEEDTDADSGVSEPKSPLSKKRRVASPPSRVQPRRTTRTASREPPGAPPPAPAAARRKTQRQPKSQAPAAAGGRASSRQGTATAAADLDGPTEAPKAARSSRRAGAGTVTAKRK
ncbi:hypothetical protein DFH06DRAFT_1160261 [Mycena polygramma]|nr:hypothetical protein DFH06DRAFT_1160261 [Mycena polygramma]